MPRAEAAVTTRSQAASKIRLGPKACQKAISNSRPGARPRTSRVMTTRSGISFIVPCPVRPKWGESDTVGFASLFCRSRAHVCTYSSRLGTRSDSEHAIIISSGSDVRDDYAPGLVAVVLLLAQEVPDRGQQWRNVPAHDVNENLSGDSVVGVNQDVPDICHGSPWHLRMGCAK